MKRFYQIQQGARLTGAQIEELRVAVGWDRMQGKYDLILARSYTHYSIMDDSHLIGFVNVISDGVADAFLVDLMIHPDFQHQGIGKALITHAINDLKARDIRCIQLTFAPELEPFYQACGFHIVKAGIIDTAVSDGNAA